MLIGGEKITDLAAKILNTVENVHPNELVEVDQVMIIVSTHYGTDIVEEFETGNLFYRCTSGRIYIQYGLLEQAKRAVDRNITPVGE